MVVIGEDDEGVVPGVVVVEEEEGRKDEMAESEERRKATSFEQVVWAPRAHWVLDTAVSLMYRG